MRPNQRKALGRGEEWAAEVVVPLASLSWEGLDWIDLLGLPLCRWRLHVGRARVVMVVS